MPGRGERPPARGCGGQRVPGRGWTRWRGRRSPLTSAARATPPRWPCAVAAPSARTAQPTPRALTTWWECGVGAGTDPPAPVARPVRRPCSPDRRRPTCRPPERAPGRSRPPREQAVGLALTSSVSASQVLPATSPASGSKARGGTSDCWPGCRGLPWRTPLAPSSALILLTPVCPVLGPPGVLCPWAVTRGARRHRTSGWCGTGGALTVTASSGDGRVTVGGRSGGLAQGGLVWLR